MMILFCILNQTKETNSQMNKSIARMIAVQRIKQRTLKPEIVSKQRKEPPKTSTYLQYDEDTNIVLEAIERKSMQLPFIHRIQIERLLSNARQYPPAFGKAPRMTTYYV